MTRSTLAAPMRFEASVKRSRFHACAAAIASAEQALAFVDDQRAVDASHNCWAWRFGEGYRSSDDGEPAGTAGRPILAAIDGAGCDRVVVLVSRWFGGIKLGAGGLVRAYGGTAAQCLRLADKVACIDLARATLCCSFDHAGIVHQLLARCEARKRGEEFAVDGLRIAIELPRSHLSFLQFALGDATRGRASLVEDPS